MAVSGRKTVEHQIKQVRRIRKRWLFPGLITAAVLFAAGVTLFWMNAGYVECSGYLEPDTWYPLYLKSEGTVKEGILRDGMRVYRGGVLLELDDTWPRWNLDRINQEQSALEMSIEEGESERRLFQVHREIEEEELQRIISADTSLFENASLTLNELKHDEYLYKTFSAGADRELQSLNNDIAEGRRKGASLNIEKQLWENRLKDCRVNAVESGVFFTAQTVLGGVSTGLLPPVGPGRQLEAGRLLGYIIPDKGMQAHIEIPQRRIASCREGQQVLLSVEARPSWRYPPVKGSLLSITPLASGGYFHAVVSIETSGADLEVLKSLICGNLTARIMIHPLFGNIKQTGFIRRLVF